MVVVRRCAGIVFSAVVSVCALKAGLAFAQSPPSQSSGAAPRTVPVALGKAERKPTPLRFDTLGTVQALSTVTIRSRVESQIIKVAFEDGALVKKDDLLFQLDSRGIEAQVKQAEGNLARSTAQYEQAQRDVKRYEQLIASDAGSRLNVENSKTQVATLAAQIQADQAALDNLRVQLSYYTIRAPITGRMSVAALKEGNIAKTGDASVPLATLNQTSPIYVAFAVPQRLITRLRDTLQDGSSYVSVTPQGSDKNFRGKVSMLDNSVDATSGTLTVRAEFPNQEEGLWPGLLCNVRVVFKVEQDAVIVPRAAVQTGQRGTFVFVVDQGVARVKPVTVDRTMDDISVISSGLQGDETVVTDGQLLITDGVKVEQRGVPGQEAKKGAS
jgi:multidrug efflux system membrane fusion protein